MIDKEESKLKNAHLAMAIYENQMWSCSQTGNSGGHICTIPVCNCVE